jgi:hypothetical protein
MRKQKQDPYKIENIIIDCMENTSKLKDLSKAIVIQSTHQNDTNKTIKLMRCFLELGEACDFNLLLLANKSPNAPHYLTFLQRMLKQGDKEFRKLDPTDSQQFADLQNSFNNIHRKLISSFNYLKKQ